MEIKFALEVMETAPLEIKTHLGRHYSSVLKANGEKYARQRWDEILKSSSLAFYKVTANGVAAGWVIVNTRNSTIVEFFVDEKFRYKGLELRILDKIIETHKLISAELPKKDTEKYELLKEYGFRPTRKFTFYDTPMITMDLSIAVYLEKLKRMPGVSDQKRHVVAIEKVAGTQTEGDVKKGIENLLEKLGGIDQFVQRGQTVVLKPNMVSDHGLRDGVATGGVVTDIKVLKAMVEILHPLAKKIIIADGSSINRSATMMMFRHYGIDKLQELYPEQVSLVDLNTDDLVEKTVPDGRRLEKRSIPRTLADADVIINLPVLKLHFAAGVSLSIKNFQGAIPPLEKYKSHFYGLWQCLINTYKIIMPHLIIIDGLVGQEDFGPVSGSPKKMDLLIGGTNPVAVDTVASKIMGLNVEQAPHVHMAYHEGLGPIEDDLIEIKGPAIDEVRSPFKQPMHNLKNGKCFKIHNGRACIGCAGYLHFVLNKLRKSDPAHEGHLLIDRSLEKNINVFIGPQTEDSINPDETNIFMGSCQQHHANGLYSHIPGCPPHTEEIISTIFSFYQDVAKPKYADETEETKLRELLNSVLNSQTNEERNSI